MNPETRTFEKAQEPIDDESRDARGWQVFKVGDTHTINGVEMRVRKITKRDVILRPVRQGRPDHA